MTAEPPAKPDPRKSSLRWRVLLVLTLAAIVPTVVVGVLAIVRARGDVRREVDRGALAHIRALGAALDGTLQDARRTVELAAATWADDGDPRKTQLLLRRLRRDVPIVSTLSIIDADGELRHGDPVPKGVDVGSHSFGGYIGDAQHVGGKTVVHLVVQARGRTGELMGVFVATLDLGFVRDVIAAARLGEGARVIVVDGAGVPVASSDDVRGNVPGEAWQQAPASLAGTDPAVDASLGSTIEGTLVANGWVSAYRNLSSYQSLRGVRWAILHQQPEHEAYALARRTTRDTLIIGGAALALALALGVFFATRLTRPLAQLAERADAIAAGHLDVGSPVEGPGEIGTLGHSIEDMARRIAERTELQTALARGDRLASVGVMSAQVAHEINNPLTTVLGYAKLLQEDKPDDHPDRAALEMIASEAERMKGIIGGLLEYARAPRQSERRTPTPIAGVPVHHDACEPAAVVRHVAALLAPQLKKARARLVTEVVSTKSVAIEAHSLQQVLVNLVQNAAQAMTDVKTPEGATLSGGTITITVREAPGGIATLITVADEGPGVPPKDRGRVFDPFFTTKAAGVGTGLGLAVCKHLIATAGGSIEVGDAPSGRGAEFRVVIPNA